MKTMRLWLYESLILLFAVAFTVALCPAIPEIVLHGLGRGYMNYGLIAGIVLAISIKFGIGYVSLLPEAAMGNLARELVMTKYLVEQASLTPNGMEAYRKLCAMDQ